MLQNNIRKWQLWRGNLYWRRQQNPNHFWEWKDTYRKHRMCGIWDFHRWKWYPCYKGRERRTLYLVRKSNKRYKRTEWVKKNTGNGSYQIATVPGLFMGAKIKLLRSRIPISREKVFCIVYASFKPFMPCKSRLFSPLLRNRRTSFPHTLRRLSAGNAFPAVRAVFDAIWFWYKECAALGTTLFVLGFEKLCIQQLIKRKYGNLKPLA